MMLQFFPSRQIALYMARLFLVRTFAVLAMLFLVLQTLDLLGESGKILAVPGNGQSAILHYISMRAPQIISFFLPFSVLLGTLITFTTAMVDHVTNLATSPDVMARRPTLWRSAKR